MVVGVFFVALILGFLLGTRARQVVASAKNVGAAVKSFSLKIPSVLSIMGDVTAAGDDGARASRARWRPSGVPFPLVAKPHPYFHGDPPRAPRP